MTYSYLCKPNTTYIFGRQPIRTYIVGVFLNNLLTYICKSSFPDVVVVSNVNELTQPYFEEQAFTVLSGPFVGTFAIST